MATGVEAPTALVATLKVALLAPAGTVTLAGTAAAAWLLESVTWAPPVGAGPFSVTVPVALAPPVTLVGLSASAAIAGAGAASARTSVARQSSTSTGAPESRSG